MAKKTIAALKKLLWKHFAPFIKRRDKNICCTCGRLTEGQNSQGGHYIAKGACSLEYYFSEKNVHCQCSNCNLRLEGNRPAYRAFLLQRYGPDVLFDLENHYNKTFTGDTYLWLLDKIEYYKNENKRFNTDDISNNDCRTT
jgi:hypothetical protein